MYIHMCVYVCYVYGYMCISIFTYLNRYMNMHIFACGSWNAKSNIFQLNKYIFMCLNGFAINQDHVSLDTRVWSLGKKAPVFHISNHQYVEFISLPIKLLLAIWFQLVSGHSQMLFKQYFEKYYHLGAFPLLLLRTLGLWQAEAQASPL